MSKHIIKAIGSIILFLHTLSSPITPQESTGRNGALRLTTSILECSYCDSGHADMAMLRISMRLTFLNVSERSVILLKGSNLADYLLVSRNEEEARNKKYELNVHVGWVTSEVRLTEGSKPGAEFVVLAPGKTYRTESKISVPIDIGRNTQFLGSGYPKSWLILGWEMSISSRS